MQKHILFTGTFMLTAIAAFQRLSGADISSVSSFAVGALVLMYMGLAQK